MLSDTADNPLADAPPIRLEFRFARPARPDAAAQPRQRQTAAHQPRQQVLQLRQFDLPLAFPRPRPPGEDVENHLRPVHDAAAHHGFDVARPAPA